MKITDLPVEILCVVSKHVGFLGVKALINFWDALPLFDHKTLETLLKQKYLHSEHMTAILRHCDIRWTLVLKDKSPEKITTRVIESFLKPVRSSLIRTLFDKPTRVRPIPIATILRAACDEGDMLFLLQVGAIDMKSITPRHFETLRTNCFWTFLRTLDSSKECRDYEIV